MSDVIRAVLRNAQHPGYGQVSINLHIKTEEYDQTIEVFRKKNVGYAN